MDFCTAFDGHCILCARQYTAQYANGIPMGTRGPAAFSSGPPFDSLPFVCFVGLFLSLIACLLSEDSFDFFFVRVSGNSVPEFLNIFLFLFIAGMNEASGGAV